MKNLGAIRGRKWEKLKFDIDGGFTCGIEMPSNHVMRGDILRNLVTQAEVASFRAILSEGYSDEDSRWLNQNS